jgi:hypothetical protein
MTPQEQAARKAYRDKLASIGYLSRGRTRAQTVISEGRAHPESGERYVTRRDENGHDVTEHGRAGTGLSDRQDVHIHAQPIIVEEP